MDPSLDTAFDDAEQDPVEQLVASHLDYARALAHKIGQRLPSHVDKEELVGYAQLGLTQAAQNFDPDMGVAFTTFSYYRIRGAVFDGIRAMHWLPPEAARRNAEMEAQDSLCDNGLGEVALEDDDEVIARKFRAAVQTLGAVFLLSECSEDETIEPINEESAADAAEQADLLARVRDALGLLDDEQATIVRRIYFEHASMTDVASDMGVNKSTVSRIHAKAVTALRDALVT